VRRLLIIDGHAYAYRAYYAIRNLKGRDGRGTNAIFGFIRFVEKYLKRLKPEYMAVVWDGGLSEERLALLPEYKAQRSAMPDDLRGQIDEIVEYLRAAGLCSLCQDGVEADDYIASLARQAERTGLAVVIASADKDFMQLVSPAIGLLNPGDKTDVIWTREQVRGKTGVEPEQIVDWLSLMGDAVDNIPGVPGVGPKTASELLGKFGTVDGIMARLGELESAGLQERLTGAAAVIRRNLEMVRLRDDLTCEVAAENCVMQGPAVNKLRELYGQWGFKGMLAALEAAIPDGQQVFI